MRREARGVRREASGAGRKQWRWLAVLCVVVAAAVPLSSAASVTEALSGAEVHVLPNGVRVVVREQHAMPLVALDAWVSAGSADERKGEESAAHFLEHMIFKGTPTRGPGEIDDAIEDFGALLNAGTMLDAAHFYTTVPSAYAGDALDVMADGIRNASLDAGEMERERLVILDEMARAESDPVHAAVSGVYAALFPGDPYGRPILGDTPAIRSVTHAAVVAFHRRMYTPANTTVVLVGDIGADDAVKAAAHAFGDWTPAPRSPIAGEPQAAPQPPILGESGRIGQRKASGSGEAAHALSGADAVDAERSDGSPAAADAAGAVAEPRAVAVGFRLGRAAGAAKAAAGVVLATVLRQEIVAQMPPSALSWLRAADPTVEFTPLRRDAVLLIVAEGAGAKALPQAVDRAIRCLRDSPLTEEAVTAASRDALGRFVYDMETVGAQARMLGLYDRTLGGFQEAVDYPTALEHVTTAATRALATAMLAPQKRRDFTAGGAGGVR